MIKFLGNTTDSPQKIVCGYNHRLDFCGGFCGKSIIGILPMVDFGHLWSGPKRVISDVRIQPFPRGFVFQPVHCST